MKLDGSIAIIIWVLAIFSIVNKSKRKINKRDENQHDMSTPRRSNSDGQFSRKRESMNRTNDGRNDQGLMNGSLRREDSNEKSYIQNGLEVHGEFLKRELKREEKLRREFRN